MKSTKKDTSLLSSPLGREFKQTKNSNVRPFPIQKGSQVAFWHRKTRGSRSFLPSSVQARRPRFVLYTMKRGRWKVVGPVWLRGGTFSKNLFQDFGKRVIFTHFTKVHSRAVCKSGAKGVSLFWAPSLTSLMHSSAFILCFHPHHRRGRTRASGRGVPSAGLGQASDGARLGRPRGVAFAAGPVDCLN